MQADLGSIGRKHTMCLFLRTTKLQHIELAHKESGVMY